MLNYNGSLQENDENLIKSTNRGLQFGDAVFEELRVVQQHIHFLEEHYLRLMSSMRILRMEIPMQFTMEFIEQEILKLTKSEMVSSHSIKLLVYRESKGNILPKTNAISYIITATPLINPFFILEESTYEVELFKDFYKNANMLSTISTNNTILNVVASIYAQENGYNDCLLLNEKKSVVESIYGNLFLVKGNSIKTPPLSDGCINGVLRNKIIEIVSKLENYEILEESISPFELQKADELFVVNNLKGINSVSKYRKKTYSSKTAKNLIGKLNASSRLNLK